MAGSAQPISWPVRLGGGLALALVLALTLGTLGALAWRAEPGSGLGPADRAAIRFTLMQALLVGGVSVLLAIPAARALARRRFRGRGVLIALLGAPFLLPAVVAVFGLLAIWGRSGLFSRLLEGAGAPGLDIYGLTGVVLAHVFFNLPLVTRLILQGWLAIPAEQFRLAAQLGFGPRDMLRRIEAPMLRAVVPGAFVVVFLLCMTSFAVALTLGGGPRATTIELAIYQAVRFDFDLARAALLALVQVAICAGVAFLSLRFSAEASFGGGLMGIVRRWDADRPGARVIDFALIVALVLFLGLPLLAVLVRGIAALGEGIPPGLGLAALRSLAVALASAALALALGLALGARIDAARARGGRGGLSETVGLLSLAASPFVIGTGLFILLHPVANPFALALPVTAAVNAAMALPFVLRALLPALADLRRIDGRPRRQSRHGRLGADPPRRLAPAAPPARLRGGARGGAVDGRSRGDRALRPAGGRDAALADGAAHGLLSQRGRGGGGAGAGDPDLCAVLAVRPGRPSRC